MGQCCLSDEETTTKSSRNPRWVGMEEEEEEAEEKPEGAAVSSPVLRSGLLGWSFPVFFPLSAALTSRYADGKTKSEKEENRTDCSNLHCKRCPLSLLYHAPVTPSPLT